MSNKIKREQNPGLTVVLAWTNILRTAKHILYLLSLSTIVTFTCTIPAYAQKTAMYEGVVFDEGGQPLVGATVTVAGTTIGTITGANGKFVLAVPEGKEVEISFIGYVNQKIKDLSKTRIVMKEDLLNLDEVVVVGYGQQKMKNVTGAISTVAPQEISDLSGGSLGTALSGLVTGLSVSGGNSRPGDPAQLTVRQNDEANSFSGSTGYAPYNGPLYVIDGYVAPVAEGQTMFNNLDVSEIESISVLKDAAAAIYGARSAQGVILVKTKQGQAGAPKISYSGQFGYTDKIKRTKMLNAYDYGTLWNAVAAANTTGNTINPARDLFQYDELQAMRRLNYDLLDQEWSAAFTQKHSVNMSGGTERATYFAGLSYFSQDGNLGKIDYDRWNYRVGVDAKIGKGIKASLQLSGDNGEKNTALNKIGGSSAETDYNALLTRPRYIPDYINGLPVANLGVSNTKIDDIQYYHFGAIQNSDNNSENMSQHMMVNAALEYDFNWNRILKGLKLKVSYAKRISTDKTNQQASDFTLYRLVNRGTGGTESSVDGHLYTGSDIDLSSENLEAITVANGKDGSFISRSTSRSDSYQLNFIASYARQFGDHDVNALFSIEKAKSETEDVLGTVQSPYSFSDGQSNSAYGEQKTSFGRLNGGTLSYIGRVNYAYRGKYLFEFLIRSDASTNFAPENYWGVFPSLSMGWVISEEDWFKNVRAIDYLKIRGSVGQLGKDTTKPWAWLQLYGVGANKGVVFGTSPGNSVGSAISSSDAPNRDAHWDKSYKINFGIDMRTLRDKMSVNIDGYYEWNRDMFMTREGSDDFPATVGTKPAAENFGEMNLWGVELSLGWQDRIGKDFKYHVRVNTGYSDNKVLERAWESPIPMWENHPGKRSDVGQWGLDCIGMFRSYQEIEEYFDRYQITNYLGNTKDDVHPGMLIYRDVRGAQNPDGTYQGPDGVVDNEDDMVRISNRNNPYGLTVNFGGEWKGLSFSAQINANWGGYSFLPKTARGIQNLISSGDDYTDMEFTNLPSFWAGNMFVYEDVLDADGAVVAAQNRDAKYPNMRYSENQETSTFWKVSGTRVTLRNVTLAYSLPKVLVEKLGIGSCRFNLTGQNMLSLYNPYPKKFMDPLSGTYGNYPNLRRITLGVNVSF